MCGEAERWLSTAYPYLHQEYQLATPPASPPTTTCLICCLRPHSGLHYGLHTCEGDKQFLKRTFHERIIYERCPEGTCLPRPRGWCKYCRLRRSLVSGVNLNLVRVGEARLKRGTKRTRDPLPLSSERSHQQIPQIYPPQVLYQPYHPFLQNQNDKFWMNPPVNPSTFPPMSTNPISLTTTPFPMSDTTLNPTTPISFPFSLTPVPFTSTTAPSATPYLTTPPPEYRPWYVGPQHQSLVQKESEHWYTEELANFLHFPRNDQHSRSQQSPPIMGFLRQNVGVKQPRMEQEQLQPQDQFLCPKLELIDEQEEFAYGQKHQQEEPTYFQSDLPFELQYNSSEQEAEAPIYQQSEFLYDHNSANEQPHEELTRPPRTSSNKSYRDGSSQDLSQPLDLSSVSSPIDLSSPSSRPLSVIPRPASVESFGPSRPSSTGSIGLSRPSSRPPSVGSSSRPPSLPGILELSGNKFSVNSVVLQDALEKVQDNISIKNFANISNLSGVLEASET